MSREPAGDAAFWREVDETFSAMSAVPRAQRAARLDALTAGRPDVRAEVDSLLDAADRSGGFLASLDSDGDDTEPVDTPLADLRIGAYRLTEPIGIGGMGTVYRAERIDGQFAHEIAVKVIAGSLADRFAEQRFRVERQILAGLHHPYIVTLIDGGVAADGRPYLAMEYVRGVSIVEYCRREALAITARLDLFRRVCGAVHYSHQHSVVHCDLKPQNILVTGDTVPKVLDFGVAKLLQTASSQEGATGATTLVGLQAMTPNYASPEQVRGLPATVLSDVYALGVLLYELLAGVRPYETTGLTLDALMQVVLHNEPRRPSLASPPVEARLPYPLAALAGDLDAIVLKALRKSPDERYASAAALSDDIGRFLDGRPVEAREPSAGYVLRKAAARHKRAFLLSAASLAIIVLLLGVSIWQARVARAERGRAQRQFTAVRGLADALIFKIDAAVAQLPQSTPVRRMLVTEALIYLEQLEADAASDASLQLEIARGYIRIGSIQGRPNTANLGDPQGAVASFQKAEGILARLLAAPNPAVPIVQAYVEATTALSETFGDFAGRRDDATAAARRGREVAERFARGAQATDEARQLVATANLAAARVDNDDAQRLADLTRARDLYAAVLAARPADPFRQRNAALADKYLGGYLEGHDENDRALALEEEAMALDRARYEKTPDDRVAIFDLAIDLSNLGYQREVRREYDASIDLFMRSLALRERLASSDPADVLARGKVAFIHRQLGFLLQDAGRPADALTHFQQAAGLYESTDLTKIDSKRNLAISLEEMARLETGDPRCRDARRAIELYTSLTATERTAGESEDPLAGARALAVSCGTRR